MSPFGRVVAAVSALHFAASIWVAGAVPGPLLSADDVAYLSLGRALAGEGAAPLAAQPPYGFLYPVLLAPGWLLGFAEPAMLTWARVVNAGLGAAAIPVLYLICRRLLESDRRWALAAAVVGASLPAALLTGSIAWTERLLPLLVAIAVLAVTSSWQQGSGRWATLAVVAAVAMIATHPRETVAAAAIVVAVAACRWRLGDRRGAMLSAGAGLVGALSVEVLRRALHEATFDSAGTYGVRDLSSRRGLGDVPDMVVHAGGTIGYLVLAGASLTVLGGIVLWQRRPLGVVPLVALAATVATAGWFLTGVGRADAWFHGRYVEVYAPVLVAAGVIGLRRLPWKVVVPVVVIAPVVAGFYAAWAGPGANWSQSRSPVMMLGVEVSGAPFGSTVFEPGAAASVALLGGLLLFGLARLGSPGVTAVAALGLITVGVFSGVDGLRDLHDSAAAGVVADALAGVDVERVAIDPTVQPNLVAALVWEIGLDRASTAVDPRTTHLLLRPESVPPPGSELVAEFAEAGLWAL